MYYTVCTQQLSLGIEDQGPDGERKEENIELRRERGDILERERGGGKSHSSLSRAIKLSTWQEEEEDIYHVQRRENLRPREGMYVRNLAADAQQERFAPKASFVK